MSLVLGMRTREQWGAVYDYTTERAVEWPATQLFLHITATRPEDHPSDDAHARYVERIGIRRFPSVGISYNALVMPGGRLYEGQPLGRRGAHTVNDFGIANCPTHGGSVKSQAGLNNLNYSGRAIALARMVEDPVTSLDVEACAQWGADLVLRGEAVRGVQWHGHKDVTSKSCPGPLGYLAIPTIQARMEEILVENDMWSKKLDEEGWRAVWRGGIAVAASEAEIVDYWWTKRASRTDAEHKEASENMTAALAVKIGRQAIAKKGVEPQFQAAWDWAVARGYVAAQSDADDLVTKEELMVFLERVASSAGVSEARVKQLITSAKLSVA